jgi:hypothetical protein
MPHASMVSARNDRERPMPFDLQTLPRRKRTRVVAWLLVEGRGDGSESVRGPIAVDVSRDGSIGCGERLPDGRYFEIGPYQERLGEPGKPDLIYGHNDHDAPNWGEGTGRVSGIAILGLVGKRESDEAAVERLGLGVPSIAGMWSAYIQKQLEDSHALLGALEERAADGFGTGIPMRFAR